MKKASSKLIELTAKVVKKAASQPSKAVAVVKKPPAQLTLPLWAEAVRGVPNAVLRGSLFSIAKQRATAQKRTLLTTVEGIEIRFKGERFNQSDLDLFEMLLHLARLQPLGTQVEFTAHALLKELGRGVGGKDHEDLKEDIARLLGGVVEITWTDTQKTFIGHLIEKAYRDENTQRYVVMFDQKMMNLYEDGYSMIDWSQRKSLGNNNLAKWLHGFYATHAQPYAYKVETLRTLSGSAAGRLSTFRTMLRSALDQVLATGAIEAWSIDESDLVQITKEAKKGRGLMPVRIK